jgi:hypothetical protein
MGWPLKRGLVLTHVIIARGDSMSDVILPHAFLNSSGAWRRPHLLSIVSSFEQPRREEKNGMGNCIDPRDAPADRVDLLVDTTLGRHRCSENARRLDTQQQIVGF